MYYRYQPYPYYRRYYNLDPYYYRRYYTPYYNYQQNIVDSQISDVDQRIVNYGDMIDVIQNSDVYQSMTPAPEDIEVINVVINEDEKLEEPIKKRLPMPPMPSRENNDGESPPQITISC